MINGTGTPSATNYIALADADRQAMRYWGVYCTAFSADTNPVAYVYYNQNVTAAKTGTFCTFGTLGIAIIAMIDNSVNYVEQEEGVIDVRPASEGKRDNIMCEMAYDAKVFGQNTLGIAISEVTNGATVNSVN